MYHQSHKNVKFHNIDKKKCTFSISILDFFLKDHVTPKTGIIFAENSALTWQGINTFFLIYLNKNVILNCNNITAFTVFLFISNKCSFVNKIDFFQIIFRPQTL